MPPLLAVLLGLAFGAPALAAEPPEALSAWPLFYSSRDASRMDFEGLGPLLFYENRPETTTYGLRPFFSFHREAEARRDVWHFLYPLTYFRRDPEATADFAFPLYYHYRRPAPGGGQVSGTFIWPLVWWGESAKGGAWLYSPLFGGTTKGMFGQDSVTARGGILYIRVHQGDYVIQHLPWPFVSWGSGPGRRSLRIWPFYGYAEREGRWWNGYVLWPFFTYGQREESDYKTAADLFSVFPFYSQARGRDGRSGSTQVLWPFFYHGWNEDKSFRQWELPFPFVISKRTDDVQAFNLWPFYGQRRSKASFEAYYLWPLVHTSRVRGKEARSDDVKVFPFFTCSAAENDRRPTRRSFWLLWPLGRSRSREEDGKSWGDANSLQFAWFKGSEGFDRNYNALFGLFEHERGADGRRATRCLWRLFRSESGPEWQRVELGPLASWESSPALTRSSFLLGLVQTGKRDGKWGWRVLFVPFGASLRQPDRPPNAEEAHGR